MADEHEAAVLEKEEQSTQQNLKRGSEKKERATKKSMRNDGADR